MSQMETNAGTGETGFDAGTMSTSGGDWGGNEQTGNASTQNNGQASAQPFSQNQSQGAQGQGAYPNAMNPMAGSGQNNQSNQGNQGGNAPPALAVPESYQLSVPENLGLEESDLTMLQGDMRGMGLSNEQANGVLAMAAKNQQAALERYSMQVEGWKDATRSDPEIGGDKLDATVRYAMSALGSFDTDGKILDMLVQSGYANNPDVIRLLSRMGKALGEDVAVTGRGQGNQVPLHERIYGAATQ